MAILQVFVLFLTASMASAANFNIVNKCGYGVWPATLSGAGTITPAGGFYLASGASTSLSAPTGWSGRIWGRTDCSFDASGAGKCDTGDCGSLQCNPNAGGQPPVTLAEFTIGNMDFYDVSLVDGYNLPMGVNAVHGTGNCQYAGCTADLRTTCPTELVLKGQSGQTVACKSACMAFNTPEYCCTGAYGSPTTCKPTKYSQIFKTACPDAYSYAYDDESSTRTCTGSDYVVTFCP
ncbi:pathogenesis-related protein 5 [Amborella trichopoda]|uniref:Thaumatin-like protein n=1 Tax=Amborella trichopoda TaxID=13333 RepID=U5D853_AMBTC|nr:pathogenesis-related protein 5 [Amborella trichopoda]ERN17587.1 hypothetical protein AMTR_s00059p00148770 [Amborella trichopoda]|eukprot:XP_006856120.1 pathogenesis-related protein 5 [Amborella trichopoda]